MSEIIEMGGMRVSQDVTFRDQRGRFLAETELGAHDSAEELANDVAAMALIFAPKGRTLRLAQSIKAYMVTATSGVATAGGIEAPYAAAQEKGATEHVIEGGDGGPLANKEEQFYARTGRVTHPGNPATHFLREAGRLVATTSATVIRKNMPGC